MLVFLYGCGSSFENKKSQMVFNINITIQNQDFLSAYSYEVKQLENSIWKHRETKKKEGKKKKKLDAKDKRWATDYLGEKFKDLIEHEKKTLVSIIQFCKTNELRMREKK